MKILKKLRKAIGLTVAPNTYFEAKQAYALELSKFIESMNNYSGNSPGEMIMVNYKKLKQAQDHLDQYRAQ